MTSCFIKTTIFFVTILVIVAHHSITEVVVSAAKLSIYQNVNCEGSSRESYFLDEGPSSCSKVDSGPTYFRTMCNATTETVTMQVFWSSDCASDSALVFYNSSTSSDSGGGVDIKDFCFHQDTLRSSLQIQCGLNDALGAQIGSVLLVMMVVGMIFML